MLNKITLVGTVSKDPEVRVNNDLKIVQFSVATNSEKDHTEWFTCACFNKLAEVAEKYIRKGSLLYIEGRLQTKSYKSKDGTEKKFQKTIVSTLKLLNRIEPKPKQKSLFDSPPAFDADSDELKF